MTTLRYICWKRKYIHKLKLTRLIYFPKSSFHAYVSCNNTTPSYWPSELYVCTHKSSEHLRRTINPPKQNGLIRISFNNIQYKIITSISTEHRKAYFEIFPEYVRMYFQSWISLFYFMFAQFKGTRKLCCHMYCLQRQITRFASKLLKITIEPI